MALAEAVDTVESEGRAVLCVLVDTAYPGGLAALRAPTPSFACALLVERAVPASSHGSLAFVPAGDVATSATAAVPPAVAAFFGDDTVSVALGLLTAIARGAPATARLDRMGAHFMRYAP
jgi:hypothetical protein